jgi:DNA-binding beta-propeller fold protein YncE
MKRISPFVPLGIALLSQALASNQTLAQEPSRFSVTTRIPVGQAPGSVALADLNRDGHLDIIVANEQSNSLTILLGDGAGRFVATPGSPIPAGHMPNDIALADFNADGALDLALANHEADYLTVLVGDGRGGFAQAPGSPLRVRARPHPHGVAATDFNGDGRPDLVTDGWETDEVEILLGDGRGGFTAHATARVGRHPYQRVRAWDVNHDGNADIITANLRGASVTVLLGDGRGGFQAAPRSPFAAPPCPTALARGDFNGDGRVDFAVTNSPSNSGGQGRDGLTVLLAEPSGGWRSVEGAPVPTGAAPTLLAAGDLDGDRRDELVVSNMNSGTVSIARLRTDGRTVVTETIRVGRQPKGIAIGDLNGDGKPDVIVANNGDNEVAILLVR